MERKVFYKKGFIYQCDQDDSYKLSSLDTLMAYLNNEISTRDIEYDISYIKNHLSEGIIGAGNEYSVGQLNALAIVSYLYWDDNEYEEDEDKPSVDKYVFVTTKEHLIEILRQWHYAILQDPKKIIFIQDDNCKITIIPEN